MNFYSYLCTEKNLLFMDNNKIKKLQTSVRLREDVLGQLKLESSKQHRSVSNYLEILLMQEFQKDGRSE